MRKNWLVILPFTLYFSGMGLNLLVVSANSGVMPVVVPASWDQVDPGTILDMRHISWHPAVHLAVLCDWIQWFRGNVCSPGDILLWLGDWLQPYGIGAWVGINLWGSRGNLLSSRD